MKLHLRFSWAGLIASGLYLGAFLVGLAWLFYSSSTNPGDSGEGGVLLLPFVMPWVMFLPDAWGGLGSVIGIVVLNAVLLYLLFGGLRPKKV